MKTIKSSKTMKAILSLVFAVAFTAFVNGQFLTPSPNSPITQTPTEDVRTTSAIVYSLLATHNAGETYRWEVTGGTITEIDGVATGGVAIVDFTADAHTITIDWDQVPATAIASLAAQIQVQKVAGGCPSQVLTLPINVWNLPTANISDADDAICSGAAPGVASLTVQLTGAPDDGANDGFSVSYEFVAPDLEDGVGTLLDGQTGTVTTNGSSVTIPLPAAVINTSNASRTLTVNLTQMQDDFNDQDGTFTDGTFVLTVNPVPETGDIVSGSSLTRRP